MDRPRPTPCFDVLHDDRVKAVFPRLDVIGDRKGNMQLTCRNGFQRNTPELRHGPVTDPHYPHRTEQHVVRRDDILCIIPRHSVTMQTSSEWEILFSSFRDTVHDKNCRFAAQDWWDHHFAGPQQSTASEVKHRFPPDGTVTRQHAWKESVAGPRTPVPKSCNPTFRTSSAARSHRWGRDPASVFLIVRSLQAMHSRLSIYGQYVVQEFAAIGCPLKKAFDSTSLSRRLFGHGTCFISPLRSAIYDSGNQGSSFRDSCQGKHPGCRHRFR